MTNVLPQWHLLSCDHITSTSLTHYIKIVSMMSHFSSSSFLKFLLWPKWIHHPPQPPIHILIWLFVTVFVSLLGTSYSHITRFAPVLCIHWELKAQQVESLPELFCLQRRQRHCWNKAQGQAMPDYITKSRSLLPHWLQQKRQQKVQCE